MLDLRFIWDDSAPSLVACSGGLKHVLLEASVMHHLPVVTHAELNVLLKAMQAFTEDGTLWNAARWSKELGRKLPLVPLGRPYQGFTGRPSGIHRRSAGKFCLHIFYRIPEGIFCRDLLLGSRG